MTVIAYSAKHRILATDSRSSDDDGMHLTVCKKVFRLKNGALLGTAGDSDDRDVRTLLAKASVRKMPSREQLADLHCMFSGILVFPKGEVFAIYCYWRQHANEWAGSVEEIVDKFVAMGCGKQFAYGAMEVGATPIQAVKAACRRDAACGLPVQWEPLP